jgi:hypothetical protein
MTAPLTTPYPLPNYYQAQWVLVQAIWPHRRFDYRRNGAATCLPGGGVFRDPDYTPAHWDAMIASLRDTGMREPVCLEYNPALRTMSVGDGNHRLHWAAQLGHTVVPAIGTRASGLSCMAAVAPAVPGTPSLFPEECGYFPATFPPSQVLPDSYFPPFESENH